MIGNRKAEVCLGEREEPNLRDVPQRRSFHGQWLKMSDGNGEVILVSRVRLPDGVVCPDLG